MTVSVLWKTALPPGPPFPDGYSNNGDDNQAFDWVRNVCYQAIAAPDVGGIEVTDLTTMDVTQLVTFDSMYAGTSYGSPPGSPPGQSCFGLTCGNNSDVYLIVEAAALPIYRRLARIDPDTWKVTGEFFVSNTITGCVYGAGVDCVNVAGGSTIVGSNGNYLVDKAQLFDGTSMAFLWYGAPATYSGSANKLLIPGAQNGDGSCDFWVINSDVSGTSGNIDFWRIVVDASLSVTETLAFTLAYSPGLSVYVQRAEWDDAHSRLLVWIARDPSSAPTLISVGTTGTVAWVYSGGPLAREVKGGHGNSRLTGTTIGVVTSIGHVAVINTTDGTLIESNALSTGDSTPPNTGNTILSTSFYDALDSASQSFFTTVLGVGSPKVTWVLPPGIPVPFCGETHTTTSFTAAWTPTGVAATSYTVDWRKVGDVSFTEVTGITDTSLLVTGLTIATEYEFKVKAINADGDSGFSDLIQCSTLAIVAFNMDNVIVQSLTTESPCTASQFTPPPDVTPSWGLRWSDTRGATFGNAVPQEFTADPLGQPQWNRTGMARDRVFELFWSAAYKTALNGAFVEVSPLKS